MVLTAYVVDIKKSMYVVLVDFSIGWYARFASKGQKWTNRQPCIKGRNSLQWCTPVYISNLTF